MTRIVVVQKRENCIRLIAVGIYRNSRCATRRKKGQKKNKKVSFWGRETKLLSRGAAVSSLLYLSLSLRELDSCRLSRRLGFSAPKDERLFLFFLLLSSFFVRRRVSLYYLLDIDLATASWTRWLVRPPRSLSWRSQDCKNAKYSFESLLIHNTIESERMRRKGVGILSSILVISLKHFFFPFQPQQLLLLAFRIPTLQRRPLEHPTLIQMHRPQLPRPRRPPGEAHTWSHLRINNTSPLWPLQGNSYQVNWFPIVWPQAPAAYVTKRTATLSSHLLKEGTIPAFTKLDLQYTITSAGKAVILPSKS